MDSLKKELIKAITNLPDNSDIDDIMYCLYVIDKVRKGHEAVLRGDTISLEDLKKEINKW
jgi:hypothetical protein